MQNDQLTIVLIILGVLVLALIVWTLMRKKRSDTLRSKYGDEYERVVKEHGGRKGETNLLEREKRVSQFHIRPLDSAEQERFGHEWHEVKALFVDAPREAVLRGDRLMTEMLRTRGYPMADFDRLYEDLTVDHANVAKHYRAGHDIAVSPEPTTEEMRRALNHYEQLVNEMMKDTAPAATGHHSSSRPERHSEDTNIVHAERPHDPPTMPVSRRVEDDRPST
jgi:hypothetical protein